MHFTIFLTIYGFFGRKPPSLFVDATAVDTWNQGIKWQSDYDIGTAKWFFAADETSGGFIDHIESGPLYFNGIYEGHDGLLDHNATHIKIKDGLLHSLDEHDSNSDLVCAVNKHLSPSPGLDFEITAPQIIAAAVGLVVVAGILCALIPPCLPMVATNLGNAITAFRVASQGAVIGNAGGVITALSTAIASVGSRDLDFDMSRDGFIGIGGYYISTELYDYMHETISKRDEYEDETFACIYNNGYVGTCHNLSVLKPVLSAIADHDNSDKDKWSCWESRDKDGTLFGWYYHCADANQECALPCANGAPIPPYMCATVNDKGGKAWSTKC